MPFLGDEEKAPPLSWVIIWGKTYSNSYGDDIPAVLRDWGYVFWDRERVMAKGGEMKAVLLSGWRNAWPWGYPRDKYEFGLRRESVLVSKWLEAGPFVGRRSVGRGMH